METAVLCGVIVFLLVYIVFKEIVSYKERDVLLNKIMAKDYVDYGSLELQKKALEKDPKDKAADTIRF